MFVIGMVLVVSVMVAERKVLGMLLMLELLVLLAISWCFAAFCGARVDHYALSSPRFKIQAPTFQNSSPRFKIQALVSKYKPSFQNTSPRFKKTSTCFKI